jgi:hypothetical protein
MTSEQFRQYWKATPFHAFALHMADGRAIRVLHPETVAMSRSGRTVAVIDGDADAFETVDLLLVTSLKPLNGRWKKSGR